jgi:hypothetical protein
MTDDIIARLRGRSPYLHGSSAERVMDEAAKEIERLKEMLAALQASSGYEASIAQVEIERLREALKALLLYWDEDAYLKAGDLERARAALESKP